MKIDEIDRLWFQAMNDSISAGEEFTRYRFAALVAAAERDACAKACMDRFMGDMTREDMEARRCAAAILSRGFMDDS